jgi:predicted DNA-binding protein (MmcQ/YjbR family)
MNIEEYRDYCLSLPGVTEEFPFDANTLVFKVMGKMFALTDVDEFKSINLKADPLYSIDLRERYSGINPGYHMNKMHWNTVDTDASVEDELMYRLIKDSYDLVAAGLSKKLKADLEAISKEAYKK